MYTLFSDACLMYQNVHNSIWKFPQDILCSLQSSSSSDNKMTQSSITSPMMYCTGSLGAHGLIASTHYSSFFFFFWSYVVLWLSVNVGLPENWMDEWRTDRLVCIYVLNLLLWESLTTWMTYRLSRYVKWEMDLINGRLYRLFELMIYCLAEGTRPTKVITTCTPHSDVLVLLLCISCKDYCFIQILRSCFMQKDLQTWTVYYVRGVFGVL